MKKNRKIYWLFLAPSLLGVAVFYCVPFLYAAYYAVIDNIGSGQFVGLQNFIDVLQNELFRTAAKNTLIFMALTVPLVMAIFPLPSFRPIPGQLKPPVTFKLPPPVKVVKLSAGT